MFEENKAVVKKWLDMVGGDKKEVWDSYLTMDPGMVWTLIGTTAASGTFNGLSEVNEEFQNRCWNGDGRGSGVQGLDFEYGIKPLTIEEVTALEDGRIVVHCRANARGKNGLSYRNEYCWIITVTDGRITKLYEFCDTALIEQVMFDNALVPAEKLRNLQKHVANGL